MEEQHNVDKDKSNPNLPKGFATEFIYNHFKNSNLPLRSSDEQFHDGHFMWRRLVGKFGLEDNHHVYFHDKNTGETEKLNNENKNTYLSKYYGEEYNNTHKHLILSKSPLSF